MQDTHISRTKKYEGFGGKHPVGGRPGARLRAMSRHARLAMQAKSIAMNNTAVAIYQW